MTRIRRCARFHARAAASELGELVEGQPRMTEFSTRRKAFARCLRVLPSLNGGGSETGMLVVVRRLGYRPRREGVASASTAARMAAVRVSCEPGSASPSAQDKEGQDDGKTSTCGSDDAAYARCAC